MTKTAKQIRTEWVAWLQGYGAAKFYSAFMQSAQGALSRCTHCGEYIQLDIREGGGIPDWRTTDGDYGCTSIRADGSHKAEGTARR